MTRKVSLDQFTVLGVTPPEMVDIAAELGYDLLGPIFSVGADFPMPVTTLERGHPLTVEMAARLKATGIAINNMDGFVDGARHGCRCHATHAGTQRGTRRAQCGYPGIRSRTRPCL